MSKITRRRWTDEEIDYIKQHVAKRSNYDIALDLGRTPMAIYEMRGRLGIDRGTLPKANRNKIPAKAKAPRSNKRIKSVKKFSFLWGLVTVEKTAP